MTRLALLGAAVLLLLSACRAGGSSSAGPLNVLAASSLTEVFPKIVPGQRYDFAGSDDLATQIEQGAPADVYAAASPKYPDELYAKGLVEPPKVFATNRLVLIVPSANPAKIESVADVARPGVKLVIGAEGVPIGDYTRTMLATLGETAALANVVSKETDVKGVVSKVALGEADAGFVYVTDVKPVGGKVRAIPLPGRAQAKVEYEIAVVKASKSPEAAKLFVDRVLGPKGQALLKQAGFGLP